VAVRRVAPQRFALPTTIVLALNPTIIYTSTMWGQNDSAITFAVLLSVVMLADSQFVLAWAIATVGALVKMQGVIVLPLLAWWTICTGHPRDWLRAAAASLATAIIVFAPFQIVHSPRFIYNVFETSAGFFPWASVNAFNLMLALGGLVVADSDKLIGPLSFFMIGNTLFADVLVLAGWMVWHKRTEWTLMYAVFLVYFGMFAFLPRMHERYLYYAVALLAPLVFSSWITILLYVGLTVTSFINTAYVFFDLVYLPGLIEGHLPIGPRGRMITSVVNLAAFALAAGYGLRSLAIAFQRPFTVGKKSADAT
jgi:Gpi18-like mannosyltransferase